MSEEEVELLRRLCREVDALSELPIYSDISREVFTLISKYFPGLHIKESILDSPKVDDFGALFHLNRTDYLTEANIGYLLDMEDIETIDFSLVRRFSIRSYGILVSLGISQEDITRFNNIILGEL